METGVQERAQIDGIVLQGDQEAVHHQDGVWVHGVWTLLRHERVEDVADPGGFGAEFGLG